MIKKKKKELFRNLLDELRVDLRDNLFQGKNVIFGY